jgi:hypothetical protein
VLLLTLLLLGSIGLQLAGPQLLRYFIDPAQDATKPLDFLLKAALIFLANQPTIKPGFPFWARPTATGKAYRLQPRGLLMAGWQIKIGASLRLVLSLSARHSSAAASQ